MLSAGIAVIWFYGFFLSKNSKPSFLHRPTSQPVGPLVAKKRCKLRFCYGPSEIAWPARCGLAGRPSCELRGLGLALPGADETGRAGGFRGAVAPSKLAPFSSPHPGHAIRPDCPDLVLWAISSQQTADCDRKEFGVTP
jgi:hypothetical protein